MDASEYNDGLRGGRVRVRAKIEVVKRNLLKIVEIPWGTTTTSLQASIVAAQEKGTHASQMRQLICRWQHEHPHRSRQPLSGLGSLLICAP